MISTFSILSHSLLVLSKSDSWWCSDSSNSHRDIFQSGFPVFNTPWCFNHQSWWVFFEELYISGRCSSWSISSWSLNKICSSLINQLCDYSYLVFCKVACFHDYLENFWTTGCLNLSDFILNFNISSILEISNVNYHIYFISSIFNCLKSLKNFGLSWRVSERETYDCSNLDFAILQKLFCLFYVRRRNADCRETILNSLFASLFDIIRSCTWL